MNISNVIILLTLIFGCKMSKGVISRPVKVFFHIVNFGSVVNFLKSPKLCIKLPNSGNNNQIYHVLTVILNQIDRLRVT